MVVASKLRGDIFPAGDVPPTGWTDVFGAINGLPGCLVDPVVACDAVDRGYRSGEDGGMADGGEGGKVADIGVFAGEAFVEQSPEAARAVAVIITI